MNWNTEIEPVAQSEVLEVLDGFTIEGLVSEAQAQLSAACAGARAAIEDLVLEEGQLVGVEFAGTFGPTEPVTLTVRVREVQPPPEPAEEPEPVQEAAEQEAVPA